MTYVSLLIISAFLVIHPRTSQCCLIAAEKGSPVQLQITVASGVTVATWQLLDKTNASYLNLTTCYITDGYCTDFNPVWYKGKMYGASIVYLMILSARINETQFRVLTNKGTTSNTCQLEVYVWPSKPTCDVLLSKEYVRVTCETDDVYPDVLAVLRRREANLTRHDFDQDHTFCICLISHIFIDDNSCVCTFRIPLSNMLENSTFYVQMIPNVSNVTQLHRGPVASSDLRVQLGIPKPFFDSGECPAGPGVTADSIQIGTKATCKCQLRTNGLITGQARWYTAESVIVGEENIMDGSSTLTVSYNPSDPHPFYQCRGINPSKDFYFKNYRPRFVNAQSTTFSSTDPKTSGNSHLVVGLSVGLAMGAIILLITISTIFYKCRNKGPTNLPWSTTASRNNAPRPEEVHFLPGHKQPIVVLPSHRQPLQPAEANYYDENTVDSDPPRYDGTITPSNQSNAAYGDYKRPASQTLSDFKA